MAERIHPITIDAPPPPPPSSATETPPKKSADIDTPQSPNPEPSKPIPPPPSAYVVQLPREQILRYPPPENSRKFQALTRRKNRRSCCRRCCCYIFCLLLLLIVAAAVTAGVLYLVFRPEAPKYTITNAAIKGLNLTSAAPVSPEFDISIRAENPNDKIGIYYLKGNAINVFFNGVKLSDGVLPAFFQPKNNVTVFQTALKGSNIVLGNAVKTALINGQNQRRVPLVVGVKIPVNIKVGSIKTWKITIKVKCDIIVDALSERANIVSKDCDYSVRLW